MSLFSQVSQQAEGIANYNNFMIFFLGWTGGAGHCCQFDKLWTKLEVVAGWEDPGGYVYIR